MKKITTSQSVMYRSDKLLAVSSNRYKITVAVAKRAKERRKQQLDNVEDNIKPVVRAIIEMSDELSQPDVISEDITMNYTPPKAYSSHRKTSEKKDISQ